MPVLPVPTHRRYQRNPSSAQLTPAIANAPDPSHWDPHPCLSEKTGNFNVLSCIQWSEEANGRMRRSLVLVSVTTDSIRGTSNRTAAGIHWSPLSELHPTTPGPSECCPYRLWPLDPHMCPSPFLHLSTQALRATSRLLAQWTSKCLGVT